MSGSSSQNKTLPAQPDVEQISHLVSSVILKARKNDTLSSLTPRLVRSEIEKKLKVPSGTLDAPTYKALVKRTIDDAMQCEQPPRASVDSKTTKSVSKQKVGANASARFSSASKSIKSKETITDSESENEPKPPSLKRKVKPKTKTDNSEVQVKLARSNSKAKSTKADFKTNKNAPPSTETPHPESKRNPPPVTVVERNSDAESPDPAPRVASSSRQLVDDEKSDSELSSLVDEPPIKKARTKPKNLEKTGKSRPTSKRPKESSHTLPKDEDTIKRLKSLVVACGVRKQWTRELNGLSTSAQIAHIRKILNDLGMVGRMSLEQAREIRAKRELAQELDDVQKFERAIVSGKPFKTESPRRRGAKSNDDGIEDPNDSSSDSESETPSDRELPQVNNARRSIMAFLQDQSSDE